MGLGFYRLANNNKPKSLCKQWAVQRHRDAVGSRDLWPITDEVGHIHSEPEKNVAVYFWL